MSVSVSYIKRSQFNADKALLINSEHIFNCNGYTSIIVTSNSVENINPLDFKSQYNPNDFKSAIRSKVIDETFAGLKVEKFDKLMLLLFLNAIQLIAIAYLLYNLLGSK